MFIVNIFDITIYIFNLNLIYVTHVYSVNEAIMDHFTDVSSEVIVLLVQYFNILETKTMTSFKVVNG